MTYWNIDSGDGNELSAGIQLETEARKIAQRTANERGESVYLYEVGNGDGESEVDSEEIDPVCDAEGRVYRVKFSNGAERGPFPNHDAAATCVNESYPGASIGHDGDCTDGGDRTLCWENEEAGVDDDGTRAIASICAEDY